MSSLRIAAIAVTSAAAVALALGVLRRRARRHASHARVKWTLAAPAADDVIAAHERPECSPVVSAHPAFTRAPVLALDGMVATSQPLATQAGLEILRMGGNAVDAAIAVAACLAVLEPCSNGLGGDFFMLVYSSASSAVAALNGSGRSPSALSLARAREDCGLGVDAATLPPVHAHTVTVPGAVCAWCDALDALGSGRLSLATILTRAINLAERGFPVAPGTAYFWRKAEGLLLEASPHGRELLDEAGSAPGAGSIFRRPGLAAVLRAVADRGRHAFYEGPVAEAIVEAVQVGGGCLSLEDLASHESLFDHALSTSYWGVRVWEHPPNGGGITALLALNVLRVLEEQGRIPAWPRRLGAASGGEDELPCALECELVHAQIECLRLAYADTAFYNGDPLATQVPVQQLLSEEYARSRSGLFRTDRALAHVPRGAPREESSTVSWQVVDCEGNAVSAVQSNYQGFGTGIVPAGCGFSLQNRGLNFSMREGSPNALGPRRRPFHTILPCILTDQASGKLVASLTNMGGYMQPQGHVQLVCRLVRRGLCPQEAVDLPRFCVLPMHAGTSPASGKVALEVGFRADTVAGLRALGHDVQVVEGYDRYVVGRAQIIMRTSNGVLWGGSDGRADGAAAGLQL